MIEPLTEVSVSCSATINGEFHIFGGKTRRRQVSKTKDCSLKRVGDLPYELYFPACGTFRFPEERSMIFLPGNMQNPASGKLTEIRHCLM